MVTTVKAGATAWIAGLPCALWAAAPLGLLTACAAVARTPVADLQQYIEQTRAEWHNVGVAVAVVQGDTVILAQGFGAREEGKAAKVDAETLFQIGSTSKALTCAALGILVDEGKLHWDDPVMDHLPEFQLRDPWLTRNLTIRDTVTHRSGIPDTPYFVLSVMTEDEALRQLRHISAQGAFRDSYHYSNLMYGVAGQVIAAVSGMSWGEFVKRRLLQPLDMKRSGASPYELWDAPYVAPTFQGTATADRYSLTDARDGNVAMPHLLDEQGRATVLAWQSYDNAAAAGAIVSSAGDMANWLRLNLNDGRFAARRVVRMETMRELHAVQNLHVDTSRDEFPLEGPAEGYAMGWVRMRYRAATHLAHGGGIIGFPAYVALMPDQKLGVAVLSNSPNRSGNSQAFNKSIAFRVLDQLLGAPPQNWSQQFLGRARSAHADARREEVRMRRARLVNAPPSLSLDRYAGEYEDRELHSGRVSIRVEGGQLTLRFAGEGAYSGSMEPWHYDVFRLYSKHASWGYPSFTLNANGDVATMSAFGSSFERLAAESAP